MASNSFNYIRLGFFVLLGLAFLIVLLYLIGKNENLFGSTFPLKARFDNVQGLNKGNNVRYAGIDIGTVKSVTILNDTLVEVTMSVQAGMKNIIRKNATASIANDGLVGNKVVNITSSGSNAPLVNANDILPFRKALDTDAMLRTLEKTNDDIALIAQNLRETITRINTSTALWRMLNDETLPASIRVSFNNVEAATKRADYFMGSLNHIIDDIKKGKGSLGAVLTDTAISQTLQEALVKIKSAGDEADALGKQLNDLAGKVDNKVNNGNGIIATLLSDTTIVGKVHISLTNIEQATEKFNESMEALKHNFLLRGYFRKQDRKKKKQQ